MTERLRLAASMIESEPDQAVHLCNEELHKDPDNDAANTLAGVVHCRAGHYGAALAYFWRAAHLAPKQPAVWNNIGTAYHEIKHPAKAREFFRRALDLAPSNGQYMSNIGVTYSDEGDHQECLRWVNKAEQAGGKDSPGLSHAKAFANLGLGRWKEGWAEYETTLGHRFRKHLNFGGVDWDGSPVETLVVYGEQGIGDEIMYASVIEDAAKRCQNLIIECDPRLKALFARSFPKAEVHGTRRLDRPWLEGKKIDAQVACASLMHLFRPSIESCPRTPYLVADPERRLMWRSLFDSYGKPVIGITWSGGRMASQLGKRTMGLESLRPLIESTDAVFVSLQYDDPTEEIKQSGLPVKWFYESHKTRDLDDLAALVMELDDMIGIHTTAHHLRGALGKPSRIFVPHAPMWAYAVGDRMAFYAAQTFIRQKKDERWIDCVKRSL